MIFSAELVTLSFLSLLCLFIAVYFFATAKNDLGNRIIGTFFLVEGFGFVIYGLIFQSILSPSSFLNLSLITNVVKVQLLYFFIWSKGERNFRISIIPKYHLWILVFGLLIHFVVSDPRILHGIRKLIDLFYIILVIMFIRKYRKARSEYFSSKLGNKMQWAVLIVIATFIQGVFPLIWSILKLYTEVDLENTGLRMLAASTVFLYLLFVLWVVMTKSHKTNSVETEILDKTKYAKSALTEESKVQHLDNLLIMMNEEKIYLDASLKLADIAERLETSPRYVSQIINEKRMQNFYEFINSFRIEHAQNLLRSSSPSKMNVSQIMYESGFNSKSSFNTLFKQTTGLTPSSFRKKLT